MSQPNEPRPKPWCCNGHAAECPLCPQYGSRLDDPCPNHPTADGNAERVCEASLHAERRHPGYEYRTTEGPRKQWIGIDDPPYGDDGEPDPTWERNVDAGRPGQGWDRFDYTEESYWRRRKTEPAEESDDADQGHPEPPTKNELNTALPVRPDPRQPAYDAVYEYIRGLGNYRPPDTVHRNAVIWRAVHAALGATPVGRCVSSHCVEGDHMIWEAP